MSPTSNPFRRQYTEAETEQSAFLRTFSRDVLEILPDSEVLWSQFVVLRSAPGAGKTSILRVLTPSALSLVIADRNAQDEAMQSLHRSLETIGAIDDDDVKILGILLGVKQDYASLVDLGPGGGGGQKTFFKLLDSRIIIEMVDAARAFQRRRVRDESRVTFRPKPGPLGESAMDALRHLVDVGEEGALPIEEYLDGEALRARARSKEASVLRRLDSLMPVSWEGDRGHARLYSLPLLAGIDIFVDGQLLDVRPILMFDDVHGLDPGQRVALFDQLRTRESRVGRWIAERREALTQQELFIGDIGGREYSVIDLEAQIEEGVRGGRTKRLPRIMEGIGNTRAQPALASLDVHQPFTSLLREADSISLDETEIVAETLRKVRGSAEGFVAARPQYRSWFDETHRTIEANGLDLYDSTVAWRELSILLARHSAKVVPALFEFDPQVTPDEANQPSSSSSRAAAKLFLAREQGLPYYFGSSTLTELSSRNIRQYLGVAADMFDLVVSAATTRRRSGASLSAREQHLQAKEMSKDLWAAIPHRVTQGSDVRALLHMIADLAFRETYRDTAPYAPGVTGIGMYWGDAQRLFNGEFTAPTYQRLARALAVAVAHNFIDVNTTPRNSKSKPVMVLYLNRLLLPHFNLPLHRGGFRELAISQIASRWDRARNRGDDRSVPDPAVDLGYGEESGA